jgi:hypothetical protein
VRTAEDVVIWINHTLFVYQRAGQGRLDVPSNGDLVHNAFLLADAASVTELGDQGAGPWSLADELRILRNMKRRIREVHKVHSDDLIPKDLQSPPIAWPDLWEGDARGESSETTATPSGAEHRKKGGKKPLEKRSDPVALSRQNLFENIRKSRRAKESERDCARRLALSPPQDWQDLARQAGYRTGVTKKLILSAFQQVRDQRRREAQDNAPDTRD